MAADAKVNILLVDDQPGNLLALEAILEDLGQNLVKARSGTEALRRLLDADFALILMDVQMPDMDGLETAALIRQRDRSRHTPIIFLTAHERTDVQMFKGYSLGAVDYLVKPIVPVVLKSKVGVFVELFRTTEEVKRQAELLRENQAREHARDLAEERRRWEMDRLREEAAREKQNAQALAQKADELARTMAERARAEEQVRQRARQQARVAELGQQALAGGDLDALLQEAVTAVAATLGVEYGLVLELSADGETLHVRAAVGWPEGSAESAAYHVGGNGQTAPLLADEPLITEDLRADPRFNGAATLYPPDVVSGISVLIRGPERPFGVLGAQTTHKRIFTRDDIYFLQAMAHVLATAIQRQRADEVLASLKDELAARLADLTQLHQVSERLANTLELPVLLQQVLEAAARLQGTGMGAVLLHDRERQDLYTAASLGLGNEYLATLGRLPLGMGAAGAAAARRRSVVIEDVQTDPLFEAHLQAAQLGGYRAVFATPLVTRGDNLVGSLALYFPQPHRPSDREAALVELYARQAAQAIDNARLHGQIQDASRRKDEFLAMLAHELRNPLAPILNALHLMRLRGRPGPDLEAARSIIERQVRQLSRLVDDLLDVSRIDRGKIELRKEPVALATVVTRATESTGPLIEARGHQLEVRLPPYDLMLEADPTRLEQVLANLLNNAAKYTEPGGRIRLVAECDRGEVVVRIQDTGIGIAPEVLPHIFDMFMQANRSLDRSEGGLGIGLTLVQRLVELHGGTVKAQSAGLGQGSEFIVRLPLSARTPAYVGARSEEKAPTAHSRRVLVVDDNRDGAESLALLLGLGGHKVRLVHDGPAALEAARADQPEVILLDIGLPGMDGYEVARQLRREEGTAKSLLVAMTGYGQAEDRRRTREAGFDLHLVKPVDPRELQEVLAQPATT
jgi:signal transduction histidine kinase/DNA-binding response OmpR family regulator